MDHKEIYEADTIRNYKQTDGYSETNTHPYNFVERGFVILSLRKEIPGNCKHPVLNNQCLHDGTRAPNTLWYNIYRYSSNIILSACISMALANEADVVFG